MHDELLDLYNQELTYLRRTGAEFARRYPGVASALQLDGNRSADPHVERLLEGFAFLAARVQKRITDDSPEMVQGLLDTVYPEYGRPVPAMSVVQFHLDPEQGKLSTGFRVPAETSLQARRAVDGVRTQFRTCYETTLWPVQVATAEWVAPQQLTPPARGVDAVAALRLVLTTPPDVPFGSLAIDRLRLHINAEASVATTLYELLLNSCESILLREPGRPDADPIVLSPGEHLAPVGFELEEGVLPVPRRSHLGLRLLTEYFAFPEKFLFLDLLGLDALTGRGGSRVEVLFMISRFELPERRAQLEAAVNADTIRLGCTPVINLFRHTSEPIRLTQRRAEYQVVADARRQNAMGIYAVEDVRAVLDGRPETVQFKPMYSYRHGADGDMKSLYWHAVRRPRGWRPDEATDVFLSFVDADAVAAHPDYDSITVRLLCHNAELPARLPVGAGGGDFDPPGGSPVRVVQALMSPTAYIPAPASAPLLWRLISLLSLNFVSLVDDGPETLQELLSLHNLRGSTAGRKQIEAVTRVVAAPVHARIRSDYGLAFARGQRIEVELDEERFAGAGVYLFASVLERFFGTYTALNSFTILRARTTRRREMLREWPPRAGSKALL